MSETRSCSTRYSTDSLTLTLSHSHTLTLPHSHTLTLSHSYTLTLSHSGKERVDDEARNLLAKLFALDERDTELLDEILHGVPLRILAKRRHPREYLPL